VSVDFSIVVPTYRRPKELAEALTSALSQTGVTIEVLVIDDSPEGSAHDVVKTFADARMAYLKNPDPTGGIPSVVRNLGWPRASGTFVHFLDDDDMVPEGHYAAVKAAFCEHPEVGIVFGRIEPFGNCPPAQLEHERRYFSAAAQKALACCRFGGKWAFTGRMLFDHTLLVCSASVFRRECVVRLAGFDPKIRLMEDADLHVRAMREFGAYFMDRTVLRYRIGSPSLMHSPSPDALQLQRVREGSARMCSKYIEERGALEYYALKLFTKTALKVI
jgi:glycosyltransferase involved in cell wall biosynthesis